MTILVDRVIQKITSSSSLLLPTAFGLVVSWIEENQPTRSQSPLQRKTKQNKNKTKKTQQQHNYTTLLQFSWHIVSWPSWLTEYKAFSGRYLNYNDIIHDEVFHASLHHKLELVKCNASFNQPNLKRHLKKLYLDFWDYLWLLKCALFLIVPIVGKKLV